MKRLAACIRFLLDTLYISYPVSWGLTFAVHLACYLYVAQHKLRQLAP